VKSFSIQAGDSVKVLATTREQFELFLEKTVDDGVLYANVEDEEGQVHFEKLSTDELTRIYLGKARSIETVKAFFFPPRSIVARYPQGSQEPQSAPKAVIIGLRSCGLKALEILDHVFLDDVIDPLYQARREKSLIITCDCSEPWETCFCTEVGYLPYPESGFDLNVTPLDGTLLVEVGSEKGDRAVSEHAGLFAEASEDLLKQRTASRQSVIEKIKKNNKQYDITPPYQQTIQEQLTREEWKKQGLAYSCVECGACTHVCPTCRCFLLVDHQKNEGYERSMIWDVCFYPGYWRMAGNLSPKPRLLRRFQNRFSCKFSYFPDNYDAIACTGCGRCIEACPGNIDIRRCLSELRTAEKITK
jgi:ferredoxin